MKQKIGILGYGETGKAIGSFYKDFFIKDLNGDTFPEKLDILHICTPFLKNFLKVAKKNIKIYDPTIVIIHTTVGMGTTTILQKIFKNKIIVHSPIRGVHPNLHKGIKTFVKYIGAKNYKDGSIVANHFKKIGIKKTKIIINSNNSEALKLWSTTQYGLMIILEKEIYKFCKNNNLDFDIVYKNANKSYNKGYKELKMENVIRPILKQMDGSILGHCVVQNCDIFKSDITKFIKEQNNKLITNKKQNGKRNQKRKQNK